MWWEAQRRFKSQLHIYMYIVTLFTIRHYAYIVPVHIRSTASHYMCMYLGSHTHAKPYIVTFPPNVPMR